MSRFSDDQDPPEPIQTARTSTKHFERPNYFHIFAHAVFCCAAYPIIDAGTVIVKDTSLFRARAIVGVWCTGIGLVIGWSLVAFATKYAEAASTYISHLFAPRGCPTACLSVFFKAWATVIHLSYGDNGPGIKLKELAHGAHKPESALSGVKLLRSEERRVGKEC